MRPSAGTMSPASTSTRSPGTTSTAGTSVTEPSRTTFACGTCRFASASMLALAFSSWRVPSTTFRRISSPTITPVETWPITKLTATTAISMMFIGSRSCSRRDRPDRRRRFLADLVRPVLRQACDSLGARQAGLGIGAQLTDDGGNIESVRPHGLIRHSGGVEIRLGNAAHHVPPW